MSVFSDYAGIFLLLLKLEHEKKSCYSTTGNCTQEVIRCQSGRKTGKWLLKITVTVAGPPQNQPTANYYSVF
jgi:hypothetical protein